MLIQSTVTQNSDTLKKYMLISAFYVSIYVEKQVDCRDPLQKDNFQINADSFHLQTPYRYFSISFNQKDFVTLIHKEQTKNEILYCTLLKQMDTHYS